MNKKKKDKNTDVSHMHDAEKTVFIEMLFEKINCLEEKIERLRAKNKFLEDNASKNSNNSHKPPSTDNKGKKGKPRKTTSSRTKSGKKPGGQDGHKGSHLKMSARPDEVITLPVTHCGHCHKNLKRSQADIEKRQMFEIPEPKMWITEYQSESKCCPNCNKTTKALYPEDITNKTQYGPRARTLMVYMNQYQFIPFKRVSEFFQSVYHHTVSAGTIVNAVRYLDNRIINVEKQIMDFIIQSKINHADESGANINGDKYWMHTVGNMQSTHFGMHKKRGRKATEAIGILPGYNGTLVHDHWKSYFTYTDCQHALCNAHHIRELRFLHEQQGIKWANKISDLLLEINRKKLKWIENGKDAFSARLLRKYNLKYDDILRKAKREQAIRGTIDSKNLLKRLLNYKDETLLFMNDFLVPFTNNLSEQDLRMPKIKQKISGCYRSLAGAYRFCRIRSMTSTAKKNGKNIFNTIELCFSKIISLDDLLVCT